MTYQQQIKHPSWQKKRLEVLELNGFKCQTCGAKEEELHVHHPVYKRGAMIWEYDKAELECLCHRCHKDAHAIDEKIKKALAPCRQKEIVLAFILELNRPKNTPSSEDATSVPEFITALNRERREQKPYGKREADFTNTTARVYREFPELEPSPNDTEDISAEKFLRTLRAMMVI